MKHTSSKLLPSIKGNHISETNNIDDLAKKNAMAPNSPDFKVGKKMNRT